MKQFIPVPCDLREQAVRRPAAGPAGRSGERSRACGAGRPVMSGKRFPAAKVISATGLFLLLSAGRAQCGEPPRADAGIARSLLPPASVQAFALLPAACAG